MNSVLPAGLIAGGMGIEEGRQTVFFTPLGPLGDETEEEYDDLREPRTVHYENKETISQDGIYWVNLGKAQDNGLQYWQTGSHVVVLYDSVPADCVEKVVSTRGNKILYQWIPTPCPPPRVVLENVWQVQHDK